MRHSANVYTHSGSLGSALFLVPLVGIVAGLVLGLLYAYITVYSPIGGYVSVLFVAGLGFGVGMASALSAKVAKCRNPAFLKVAGFAVGLATLYGSWVFFEFVLLRHGGAEIEWANLPGLFLSPAVVWELASSINEDGWFSIGSFTPSGIVLWILWAIEAMIIVGIVTIATGFSVDDEVFCERCNQWIETGGPPLRLTIPEGEDLQTRVAGGELEALESLTPATDIYPFLAVDLKECDRCKNMATYQVKMIEQKVADDNTTKVEKSDLTEVLRVPADALGRLKELRRPL